MSFNIEKLALNSSSNNDNQNSNNNQANAGQDQQWAEVGQSVKKALDSYQTNDKVDYVEVGALARKAASAYHSSGGKMDAAEIGKAVIAGAMGKGNNKLQGQGQGQGKNDDEKKPSSTVSLDNLRVCESVSGRC